MAEEGVVNRENIPQEQHRSGNSEHLLRKSEELDMVYVNCICAYNGYCYSRFYITFAISH